MEPFSIKSQFKILILTGAVWALVSCGATTKTVTITESSLIQADYNNKDIVSLIGDLERYPLSRGLTEDLLFKQLKYEDCSYNDLKNYANAAEFDYKAFLFFDSLKFDRQEKVLKSLSQKPLKQVGEFYRQSGKEHDYLRSTLLPLFDDVDSLDYESLKELNTAFSSTDLQIYVKPRYTEVRDSLLTEICQAIDGYFSVEQNLAQDIETAVRTECEDYIEDGVVEIVSSLAEKEDRGLFKKVFKRQEMDKYSFEEYANLLIENNLNPSYVEDVVRERLYGWFEDSNVYRDDLIKTYFTDTRGLPGTAGSYGSKANFTIGRQDIDDITAIKAVGSALGWGSFALGFFTGGLTVFLADLADMYYSTIQDDMVNDSMSKLTQTLYDDSIEGANQYISAVFGKLNDNITKTRDAIKHKLYEEF